MSWYWQDDRDILLDRRTELPRVAQVTLETPNGELYLNITPTGHLEVRAAWGIVVRPYTYNIVLIQADDQ